MRYRVITYGCQMNERDSSAIGAMLEDLGYHPAQAGEAEDLVVFNTCCVREAAERKIVGRILEYKAVKLDRPGLLVGVGGCMMQQPGAAGALSQRAPWLDFIYGTHNLDRLPVLVAVARTRARMRREIESAAGGPLVEIYTEPQSPPGGQPRVGVPGQLSAHVSISSGCDNYCSYCIVPHVRGRERSRQPDDIVGETVALARSGVREITLLGQNVNSYGHDLGPQLDFAWLLQQIDQEAGDAGLLRLRFMTSHPKDLGRRLIEAMAGLPTVCEHIHLPVQAGSDRILAAMNRGYTAAAYLAQVKSLRAAMPGVGLTTDVIVGFPGESEEDFEETLELMRAVGFDSAFTFAYSRRSGTSAAELPNQIPAEVRRQRLARLNRLQEEIGRERLGRLTGTTQEVLFFGPSDKDQSVLAGRTRTFHYVLTPGPLDWSGHLGTVLITAARTWTLSGQIVAGQGMPAPAGGDCRRE